MLVFNDAMEGRVREREWLHWSVLEWAAGDAGLRRRGLTWGYAPQPMKLSGAVEMRRVANAIRSAEHRRELRYSIEAVVKVCSASAEVRR